MDPQQSGTVRSADILILGASFAGVELLYQIVRLSRGGTPKIMVVDRQRTHGYLPLVQERLTRVLQAPQSELDTAHFVDALPGAQFVQGEVEGFDHRTKTVSLADGRQLRARIVVVALGSSAAPPQTLPGHEHLHEYKTADGFARADAALETALSRGGGMQTTKIVVVGGGISGCELAGDLARLARDRPKGWSAPEVTLISASAGLVPGFSPRVGAKAQRILEAQGVCVRQGSRVSQVHAEGLRLAESDGEVELAADLGFWAGGVRPATVLPGLGLPMTCEGWLSVGPTLQCFASAKPTHPEVFACGDAVRVVGANGQWPTMQRAIECIWQAKVVAINTLRLLGVDASYPGGVPVLLPHRLRKHFFYGLSLGERSLVMRGRLMFDVPGLNHTFRRWLMRRYFARYLG